MSEERAVHRHQGYQSKRSLPPSNQQSDKRITEALIRDLLDQDWIKTAIAESLRINLGW
jgi:hypothetical protein